MLIAAPKAYATETTVTVSDAQTEMFSTSVYLTDFKVVTPVVESMPTGWAKWTNSPKEPVAYYNNSSYYSGGNATIKVRYHKIAKANGS